MSRIVFKGRLDNYTGFGQQFCHLIQFCIRAGYEVLVIPVSISEAFTSTIPPEIKSRIGRGRISGSCFWKATHLEGNKTGDKDMIYSTVWETDLVLPASVRSLNAAKCVVVPSEWCADASERSGITVPVRVVPHGLDKSIYHYRNPIGSGQCVFGAAGRLMHGPKRKGLAQVVEAFLEAFPNDEDVLLKIKTFADDKLDIPDDPRIEKTLRFMSEPDVASWLGSLTCFVSAARAEGWGLWQHQALSCGRPVICPRYGGVNMFLTENNSYPVEFGLVQSGQDSNETGNWCNPFTDSLVEQMRRVHQDRAEAAAKGRAGSIETSDFTVERSCLEAIKVMEEFGGLASASVVAHSDETNSKLIGAMSVVQFRPGPMVQTPAPFVPPPVSVSNQLAGALAKEVVFRGQLDTYTGYGQAFCPILEQFIVMGFDVKIRATQLHEHFTSKVSEQLKRRIVRGQPCENEWEWQMLPMGVNNITKGKKVICHTMWESDGITPKMVEVLNQCVCVVVPSQWNKTGFAKSGVTVPIRVVPLGIDRSIFRYRFPHTDGICVFGAAGRVRHGRLRKGIDHTIEAFKTAFPTEKDVRLDVKCFTDDGMLEDKDSRVRLKTQYLSDAQCADWLAGLTAFAGFWRGEGWGFWQHKSASVGRPIIGPLYSAPTEFMNETNSYPVRFTEEPASEFQSGSGNWCCPDPASLIEQMRRVYENRQEAIAIGIAASISAGRFTLERSALGVLEVMKEFGMA